MPKGPHHGVDVKNLVVVGALAALTSALAGCEKVEKHLPDIPDPDVALPTFPLPKNANGLYELLEVAGSSIQIDPTLSDPISAVGRCTDLITACYEGGTALDACVDATRRCTTHEPWKEKEDCCPSACVAGFASERKTNADALASYEKVFFLEPGCFPGVLAALEAP